MSSNSRWRIVRRDFLKLLLAVAGGMVGGAAAFRLRRPPQPRSRVAVYRVPAYDEAHLTDIIRRGLTNYPQLLERVRGGRVVLKPNIVEYYEAHRVNTHPAVVGAAIEAFRHHGAGEVIVAEGPGHRRDMELLLNVSGFREMLTRLHVPFVDLNLDTIAPVALEANYTRLNRVFLPVTVLEADVLVSMPKLKVHHWVGVTLSLKNMFGVAPGVKYGWPKNILHWRGIHNSVADLNLAARPAFAIIDGIEGMEGDGPLYGDTVQVGVLLMGDNLTATDATAARLMGVYPERIRYFTLMAGHGGTVREERIEQIAEDPLPLRMDFRVLDRMALIKTPPPWWMRLFI